MGPHIEDKISHSKIEPNLSQWRVLDQESAPSHQGNYRGYVSDSQRSMTDLFELRFLFRNLLICIFLQFAIKENLAEIFKFFQSKQSRLFSIFNQIGLKNQFHRFQQNWIFWNTKKNLKILTVRTFIIFLETSRTYLAFFNIWIPVKKGSKIQRVQLQRQAPKVPHPPLCVFIRNLLHNQSYNPDVVCWVSETQGIFKVTDTVKFGKAW